MCSIHIPPGVHVAEEHARHCRALALPGHEEAEDLGGGRDGGGEWGSGAGGGAGGG
jgi:hypothetical protein